LIAGRNIFGDNYNRFAVFMRLNLDDQQPYAALPASEVPERESGAEILVSAGANATRTRVDLDLGTPVTNKNSVAPYVAVGARRAVSDRSDLGARLELFNVDGHNLLAVRGLDYRYRTSGKLAIAAFLGAARYDIATPAYGVYGGVGAQWRDIRPGWDLGLDLSCAFKVARDHLLPNESNVRPDSFYDIYGATLSLTRRF
jgi:hypothetical protein